MEILNTITAIEKVLELFQTIDTDNKVVFFQISKKNLFKKCREIQAQYTEQNLLLACEMLKIIKNEELQYKFYVDIDDEIKFIERQRQILQMHLYVVRRVINTFRKDRKFNYSRKRLMNAIQVIAEKYEDNRQTSTVMRQTLKMREMLRQFTKQDEIKKEQKKIQKSLKRKRDVQDVEMNKIKDELKCPRKSKRLTSAPLWLKDFVCAKK